MFQRSTLHSIVLLILYVGDMVIIGSDLSLLHLWSGIFNLSLKRKIWVLSAIFLVFRLLTPLVAIFYLSRSILLIFLSVPPWVILLLLHPLLFSHLWSFTQTQTQWWYSITAAYTLSGTGGIPYISSATRPDICLVVHVLSQFVRAPTSTHYATLFRVTRYLRSTISQSLLYSFDSSLSLRAYSYAE